MSERQVLTLRSPGGAAFDAALGAVLAETPSTLLIDGERVSGGAELPARVVIKRGKRPADFGRLDLEQVACERLEHPGLARYFGAARTPELGTVLAFERLGGSPLLLFNAQGTRPAFRDPGTVHYPLPPGIALELAFDALLALEHVHSRGFVHGGVTLTNLLVRTQTPPSDPADLLAQVAAGSFHGVLGGLGGARELTFLDALRDGLVDPDLTPRLPDVYASPEALLELSHLGGRRVYSQAMDMYAFGLLTYTLLTGHAPYDHLCAPHELTHRDVVTELKLRESRGDLSPILPDALRDLPLHDSPFVAPTIEGWPVFHAAVRRLLARCLDRDPARRLDATAAKELFCSALELRPSPVERVRPWIQGTFQLLSGSNRLRGDRPGAGLSVRQEEGSDTIIVEVRDAPPAAPEPQEVLTDPELDPSLSIAFRVAKRPPAPAHKRRISPPVPLRDIARAFHAKEPLPVQGPFLVTSTSLDKDSLARTVVYSLGSAVSWVVVADGGVQEQLRLIIGRTPENDIVCADGKVSKKHAALGFDRVSGHWYVEDLRSANGTRVDGRDAPPNVKTRLRKAPAIIDVGTGVELTYMESPQLLDFLAIVVDAVKRAAEAAKRRAVTDLLDEAWQGEPEQEPPPQVARTRRLQRPTAGNTTVKFPVARVAPRPDWDGLARRLQPHVEAGASFRIVLTGSIVEHAASVAEAIAMLKEAGSGLVSLEAEFPDHRILIFARPDPKTT